MFSYQREQVWGLITSVSKSGTFPTLCYLGISWPESGLSSLVAKSPLLGKQQQATAAVAWRLVGNVPCRTGGSGLAPRSVLLCRPMLLLLPRQPRLTSGLPPHVPFGFGTAVLVAEHWAPNLWAKVVPWGWATLPFCGTLLKVKVHPRKVPPAQADAADQEGGQLLFLRGGHRCSAWALPPRSLFDTLLF